MLTAWLYISILIFFVLLNNGFSLFIKMVFVMISFQRTKSAKQATKIINKYCFRRKTFKFKVSVAALMIQKTILLKSSRSYGRLKPPLH